MLRGNKSFMFEMVGIKAYMPYIMKGQPREPFDTNFNEYIFVPIASIGTICVYGIEVYREKLAFEAYPIETSNLVELGKKERIEDVPMSVGDFIQLYEPAPKYIDYVSYVLSKESEAAMQIALESKYFQGRIESIKHQVKLDTR